MQDATDSTRFAYSPVQTKRAFEEVALQIREQLTKGALKPGDRLPSERELAEQFGLSRNTVREALRSLEMSGILEFRKGATGGAFVREGHSEAVISGFSDLFRMGVIKPEDLIEARRIVGVEVTRLACQRATDADIDELERNVAASQAAGDANDDARRIEINLAFHALLARAAKNPVLVILTDALVDVQGRLLQVLTPTSNAKVIQSRKRLLKFLRARDEGAAVAEMQAHLTALEKHYLSQDFIKLRRAR
jgi:GntR family transcriptional regulator, transcriptional repressor for pyruvate dehydrogenase complex